MPRTGLDAAEGWHVNIREPIICNSSARLLLREPGLRSEATGHACTVHPFQARATTNKYPQTSESCRKETSDAIPALWRQGCTAALWLLTSMARCCCGTHALKACEGEQGMMWLVAF